MTLLVLTAGLAWAVDASPGAVNLTRLPFAELEVANPRAERAPATIPVPGPWRLVGATRGIRSYEAPLPVRPRSLFFEQAPEGMELRRGAVALRYGAMPDDADEAGTWQFTADSVVLRVKTTASRPGPDEVTLRYPQAQQREDALHRGLSKGDNASFVVRSAQVDDVTRRGLYLPVPSYASWDLTVPEEGRLELVAGVLPPEIDDGVPTDGADLVVTVDGEAVRTQRAFAERWDTVEVDLGKWSGKRVRLALQSRDDDPARDHLFVAAPRVYVPKADPKRVLLVFIDTLRRDHLGAYGYSRPASPKLDAWARDAVVFDQMRSVAPWTLPSARALLSGRQPEEWSDAVSLPDRLSEAGWATAAYVGNVYLSSNFEMAGGWDEHGCVNWPSAELETERALDWLGRNEDRDALLLVHYMDMHLPYKEPYKYRGLYAGDPPGDLPALFTRYMLLMAATREREAVKRYLIDRYDQNLRYIDDQLARLISAAGDDATVVVFADHGEEFFDHGDLEHGHTLYDELLRVPFLVKSPGLPARRVDTPASLLDVMPTLLEIAGLAPGESDGASLLGVARGEAPGALATRAIAFGRPLYGNEAWGSLEQGLKYVTRAGAEKLYDLRRDPQETENLREGGADVVVGRAALEEGLGRPLRLALRITPRGRTTGASSVELVVPGGVEEAWVADDPTRKTDAAVEVSGEKLQLKFRSFMGMHREVFVVPNGDAEAIVGDVRIRIDRPGIGPSRLKALPYDGTATPLGRVSSGGRSVEVTWAMVPLPAGQAVSGFDPELAGALQAMGYLSDDRGEGGGEGGENAEGGEGGENAEGE